MYRAMNVDFSFQPQCEIRGIHKTRMPGAHVRQAVLSGVAPPDLVICTAGQASVDDSKPADLSGCISNSYSSHRWAPARGAAPIHRSFHAPSTQTTNYLYATKNRRASLHLDCAFWTWGHWIWKQTKCYQAELIGAITQHAGKWLQVTTTKWPISNFRKASLTKSTRQSSLAYSPRTRPVWIRISNFSVNNFQQSHAWHYFHYNKLVRWSSTSLFSTNMAISEPRFGRPLQPPAWERSGTILVESERMDQKRKQVKQIRKAKK